MDAVILAGGAGTRLQSIVKDVPKPMADINGRPFLSYLMDYLSDNMISRVLLSVGYKYEIIEDYFGSRYKNMDVEYVIEDKPLGTGGAIKRALEYVRGAEALVLNGDTFLKLDIKKMMDFHIALASTLTIAVKPMCKFDRYGTIVVKGDNVIDFQEKAYKDFGYINAGVYIIKKTVLESLRQTGEIFSFEVAFLQKNIKNIKLFAFICDNYFIDIGIPEDYEKAQKEFKNILKRE